MNINRSFKRKGQTKKIMKTRKETSRNEIAMLQYQLQRYKAMGNGAICQSISSKINKLITKQA